MSWLDNLDIGLRPKVKLETFTEPKYLHELPLMEAQKIPTQTEYSLSETKLSEPITTQLLTYPINAARKTSGSAGLWKFNLRMGLVTLPDGSSEKMTTSLIRIRDSVCRSCFILVSDADAQIKIGSRVIPYDHQLVQVINNLEFDQIEIDFPTGRTPTNDFQLIVTASNNPIFPLQISQELIHNKSKQTGTAANTYATIYNTHVGGYDQAQITIENTHGSYGLTAKVEYSEDGSDYYIDPDWNSAAELNISSSSYESFATSIKHHFYKVSVKNQSSGQNATYTIHQNVIR